MSRFLAPIHFWLFKKIQLHEGLEHDVLSITGELPKINRSEIQKEAIAQFGPFLDDKDLAEIIDQGNIHGWLQERIRVTESRMAFIIDKVMEAQPDEAYNLISQAFATAGARDGDGAKENVDGHNVQDIFKTANDYILEGMPCDRANAVTVATDTELQWQTSHCLHEKHWGAQVGMFYSLRRVYLEAFFTAVNPSVQYGVEPNSIDNPFPMKHNMSIVE